MKKIILFVLGIIAPFPFFFGVFVYVVGFDAMLYDVLAKTFYVFIAITASLLVGMGLYFKLWECE